MLPGTHQVEKVAGRPHILRTRGHLSVRSLRGGASPLLRAIVERSRFLPSLAAIGNQRPPFPTRSMLLALSGRWAAGLWPGQTRTTWCVAAALRGSGIAWRAASRAKPAPLRSGGLLPLAEPYGPPGRAQVGRSWAVVAGSRLSVRYGELQCRGDTPGAGLGGAGLDLEARCCCQSRG